MLLEHLAHKCDGCYIRSFCCLSTVEALAKHENCFQYAIIEMSLTVTRENMTAKRSVILPCSIGQTLYRIVGETERPINYHLQKVIVEEITLLKDDIKISFTRKHRTYNYVTDFGETLFFTEEEAKAKLEELKKMLPCNIGDYVYILTKNDNELPFIVTKKVINLADIDGVKHLVLEGDIKIAIQCFYNDLTPFYVNEEEAKAMLERVIRLVEEGSDSVSQGR